MTSKKPAREKRANPPRSNDRTKTFRYALDAIAYCSLFPLTLALSLRERGRIV